MIQEANARVLCAKPNTASAMKRIRLRMRARASDEPWDAV